MCLFLDMELEWQKMFLSFTFIELRKKQRFKCEIE